MGDVEIRLATWQDDEDALRRVRAPVFIDEQRVPEELEWDELDPQCVHALALAQGEPVGTGRLTPDGYIGRMAVLPAWRTRGVGTRLLRTLMDVARARGDAVCRLHAQVAAIGFYERFGFRVESDEFMDAGIPHRTMALRLDGHPAGARLEGHQALAGALVQLARAARAEFAMYAPDLAPRLTDAPEFAEALRVLALSGSRARIRLLCREAREAARGGHAVLRVAAVLPSRFAVHRLAPEDDAPEELFAFADREGVLRQPRVGAPSGQLALADPALAREYAERYELLWERSRPDPDARRLAL